MIGRLVVGKGVDFGGKMGCWKSCFRTSHFIRDAPKQEVKSVCEANSLFILYGPTKVGPGYETKKRFDWPLLGGSQVSKARPGAPIAWPVCISVEDAWCRQGLD
jgi:hypothetical protein